MSLIYCYGVVEGSPRLEGKGFESRKVYAIKFKDISAVVSDVSEKNFSQKAVDKNVKNLKWLAENAQFHENVVDSVMKKTTVIPMKFCTIFKAKRNVTAMLKEKYADFKYNLTYLRDMVEVGVKVYYNEEPLKQKILKQSSELKKLEKEAKKKTPGAAYFEKQKIEILLREKLQQKLAGDGENIFRWMGKQSEKSRRNELLDKKVTGKDMALNAVFLIKKQNLDDFKEGVNKVKSKHRDMEFQVWGPFPPYNFIK